MAAATTWDIGLNLLFLHPRMAGVRVVATQLLQSILQRSLTENDYRFRLFVTPEGSECLSSSAFQATAGQLGNRLSRVEVAMDPKRRLAKIVYEQLRFLNQLKRVRLVHSFDYTFPLLSKCRNIATVHDLNYLNFPQTFSRGQRLIRKILVPLALKRADCVLTVSDTSKQEIESVFRIDPQRLRVVYNGFQPPAKPSEEPDSKPYALAIGTLKTHKNYGRLIEAFSKLTEFPDLRLAIVGRDDGSKSELQSLAAQLGIERKVEFLGFVSSEELASLFQRSKVFVFPSLYEGFGMPILEAMARDLPVACSHLPVLKEVGGEAAVYFDPYDVGAIADSIRRVLLQEVDVEHLVELGRKQVTRFSWSTSAQTVLGIYDEMLLESRAG